MTYYFYNMLASGIKGGGCDMPKFSVKFFFGKNCSITYDHIVNIKLCQYGVRIVDDDYWSTIVSYEDFFRFEVEMEVEDFEEWS